MRSRHSRCTEPMNRSTKGFCQGERGARDFLDAHSSESVAENSAVDLVAVTHAGISVRGSGNVLTICRAVQAAVGCSVTLKCRTRRRACADTRKT